MIFGGGLGIFICLNQDFQDLRIFRMLFNDFWWGVGDFYLSESGFPGFEDLQDFGLMFDVLNIDLMINIEIV